MSKPEMNLNLSALSLVKRLCNEAVKYGVSVEKTLSGATVIDAGINARGGFLAGKMVTEICLGGYGQAKILPAQYGDVVLPSIYVHTDYPAIATLASQFAGWRIKVNKYSAIGSGPARALALKPKELYEKIMYTEKSEVAVLVLETNKMPPEDVIQKISNQCEVRPENLFLVLVSTACLAGSTQVSGRIVETGLHKLEKLGLDPNLVQYAWGYAPIIPLHPRFDEAMGRTNDAILYGGTAYYIVNYEDDAELEKLVRLAPSSASKMIQEAKALAKSSPRFLEIFKEAGFDFYEIDPNVFAPAIVVVNNMRTGKIFRAGSLDIATLKDSFGL
ncbi:MAG: methenyltetrahydromethanopterin cyclohydrolase [Candidatus Bathyarchaeota archaeon]